MKTLANCSPREFMTQAVKLRDPFVKWLQDTGISEIRKRLPEGYDKMNETEKREAIAAQSTENFADMLYAAMEKDPEGTLNIINLCCFGEGEEGHTMVELLEAVLEMLSNKTVRDFFTLFVRPKMKTSTKG